jgi:hypothetical protein
MAGPPIDHNDQDIDQPRQSESIGATAKPLMSVLKKLLKHAENMLKMA